MRPAKKRLKSMPEYYRRKPLRADFHDYSGGCYFVTICTREKSHYFGEIYRDEMLLSVVGQYCQQQFESVNIHYPYAQVLSLVVMPNHVHAIIEIDGGYALSEELIKNRTHEPCVPTNFPAVRMALGVVVGGVKRDVTLFARRSGIVFGWQSRYHDHIIRGVDDRNRIAEYIETNVARWRYDCFYNE